MTLAFLLVPLFSSIFFYLLGFSLLSGAGLSIDTTFKPLYSLLVGILVSNLIASVIITRLETVQLLFIVLLGILWWQARKQGTVPPWNFHGLKNGLIQILTFTGIWSMIYFVAYFKLFLNTEIVEVYYLDLYYFVRIADNIWRSGEENIMNTLNQMSSFSGGASPYHYFELYQTLLLSKPFGLNPLWAFTVSLPICFCVTGSYVLKTIIKASQIDLQKGLVIPLAVAFLFISGFNLLPFDYVENGAYSMNMVNNALPKYFPLFVLMLLVGFYVTKRKYITALVLVCMLLAASYTMAPLVLFIGFGGIVLLKFSKEISWEKSFLMLSLLLFSVVFVFGFYQIQEIPPEYIRLGFSYSEVIRGLLTSPISIIKRAIGTHVYYSIDYFIFLAPITIACLLTWKTHRWKTHLPLVLFFLLVFEGGIIATTLLDGYHTQSWQPQYIALTIGSNAFLLLVLITMFQHNLRFRKLLGTIYLVVILINAWHTFQDYYVYADERMTEYDVSRAFYDQATKIFAGGDRIVAFIETSSELPAIYPVGSVLTHINPNISLESIDRSILTGENPNYQLCTFQEYVKEFPERSINDNQLHYLLEFEVKHVVGYEKNDTYRHLSNFGNIVLGDQISGLYVLEIDLNEIQNMISN